MPEIKKNIRCIHQGENGEWQPLSFTECININLEEGFSLCTTFTSLLIQCELYII